MASQVPPNVVDLLKSLVGAAVMQQAQIAELQADRTVLLEANEKLTAEIAALQGHAETLTGDAGLTTQLGDLSKCRRSRSSSPPLFQRLRSPLPCLDGGARNIGEPQQAAA